MNQTFTGSNDKSLTINANFPVDFSKINFETVSDTGNDILKALKDSAFEDSSNEGAGVALNFNPHSAASSYNAIWRPRDALLPMTYTKQVVDNNDLVRAIVQQLGFKVSTFGRPQVSHTDTGYKLILRDRQTFEQLPVKQQEILKIKARNIKQAIYNCGYINDDDKERRHNFPEFIKLAILNGLMYGWCGVEVVKNRLDEFYCWKSVDMSTMYLPPINSAPSLALAQKAMQALKDKQPPGSIKFIEDLEKVAKGDPGYEFVQVIDGIPYTAFPYGKIVTETFYPSDSINDCGYPRPPMDSITKQVSSHSNISTRQNLIFALGRASRGFFLIKSTNIPEQVLQRLRQNFNASINGVGNSFRVPVFSVGPNDDIQWRTMESEEDGEFEYLTEVTARVIMAAYGISPEEMPGYSHLVRPAPGQTLPEADNLFMSTYGKGSGFRLCMDNIQSLMNKLIRQMDPDVADHFRFKFLGLEEDSPAKELARAQSAINLYSSIDDLNHEFDHERAPIGGNIPLNPQYLNAINGMFYQNEIIYAMTKDESKLLDPTLFFIKDQSWMAWVQQMPALLKDREKISNLLGTYFAELCGIFSSKS